ncbi:hypothetical protein B296_00033154 [Ensete ventricosum]|uniref:aspartate kinase n=1 Tax=Ensete ventricosum TaxID=4639 RepID=A0A426ZTV0_ENSVE|nr:hypothetical protein B296_00033154 [Ensete ventricosum]
MLARCDKLIMMAGSFSAMQHGRPCCWMDTRDVLIVNPTSSNQVDPDYIESEKRLKKWLLKKPADIIIATGFIASTLQNIPTTLKRDGSDFSAAILSALLKARQVTIWTDVDGVFSADPSKVLTTFFQCAVSEAVILRTLSYQEAWEMVEVIPKCSILATVGHKMASTPGVSATLFDALAKHFIFFVFQANINVRAIAQGCSEYNITLVLKQEDCVRALRAAHSRFYLSKTTLAMGIIGPGLIGGTLLDQLRDQVIENIAVLLFLLKN